MQKSTIGTAALLLTAALGILTAITLLDARLTETEGRALADLRRPACNARALTFEAQLACARIEPDTGWAVHRLPIPGFFGLITWLTLGFGLAMLAKPDADKPADLSSTEERERQRRLALAAQEKLREQSRSERPAKMPDNMARWLDDIERQENEAKVAAILAEEEKKRRAEGKA